MVGGPFSGVDFAYYGAHTMRQGDGTVVLGWRDLPADRYSHEHRYRYAADGAYLGTKYTDCPGLRCYWSKWNDERDWNATPDTHSSPRPVEEK